MGLSGGGAGTEWLVELTKSSTLFELDCNVSPGHRLNAQLPAPQSLASSLMIPSLSHEMDSEWEIIFNIREICLDV